MNLPQIRSKYPLSDRLGLALACCCANPLNPVETLKKLPPLFKFEEQYREDHIRTGALKLKICETGSLLLDPNVIHPFVRVSIVDMDTYKYLAK